MPLFQCTGCGCVENTALSGYWTAQMEARKRMEKHAPKCSACNPAIGAWHGVFPRKSAAGYLVDKRGFLYTREQRDRGTLPSNVEIVGEVGAAQ
jgi:hypothetical protein